MNNFTNNRWISFIVLLLLTVNLITLALLWTNKKTNREYLIPPPPPQPQQNGQVFEFITHELKLDSTQQEAYKKLRDEQQSQVRPLQDNIGKAKDIFFALLQKETVSDSTIEAYSKRIGNLEQQRDVFTFRHFQKLRAICTKEQQVKFDNIIQQALRQMSPQRGPRPKPGPGMEGADTEKRDGPAMQRPGMKPAGNRLPPPTGMRPPGDGPAPEMRPDDGYRPPPGVRRPPPAGRMPAAPRPGGPPQKDSI